MERRSGSRDVDDVVYSFIKEKGGPFLKKVGQDKIKTALYVLYVGLILSFIIFYGYLVTIAIQLSKARQFGRRLQEECGDVYMEAETARNQIYNTYNGDIATRLNEIKNGIFALSIIIVTVVYVTMLFSVWQDKQLINNTLIFVLLIIAIMGLGWIAIFISMITTYAKFNTDYRDKDPNTAIKNAETALVSIDGTFGAALGTMISILVFYLMFMNYKNIDGSQFVALKNHFAILIVIVFILYIVLRLYSNMVNNMNTDILTRYNEKIIGFKSQVVKPILTETSAVNYLQNNLRRLEPNSKETINIPQTNDSNNPDPNNYYRLLEHRLGQESYYYADATVPAKIKAADMQGLVDKYKSNAIASRLIAAIKERTLQNEAEYNINITNLPFATDGTKKKFDLADQNTAASILVGAELLDIMYSKYSVLQPHTPQQNFLALFSETEIATALSNVRLTNNTSLDLTNIQNVFNATEERDSNGNPIGPNKNINISGPSETVNVPLKSVYLALNQLKHNNTYRNTADEIIQQVKMNLLYTMLSRTETTSNTRDILQTKMAELRAVDYVETTTDDFTRLIAIGFIFPVIIIFATIYNKIYNANPGYTTMAIVIFIFAAIFAITWYAWFAGNILL